MVSVVQREWAAKNPRATFRAPITIEDVPNSRMIAYPSGNGPPFRPPAHAQRAPEKLPYSRGMYGPCDQTTGSGQHDGELY